MRTSPGKILAPAALVEKPYRLNEVLGRLGALLSPRGRLNRSWERVGAHALRAIDHMAGHFQEPLRVADVARAVGLSADRLAHVFHDGIGMAVTDYLERLRVAVGRRLLAETDVKLEEVARGCGFADASHFSRVFVNHIGMRPGAYRRRAAGLGNDQANAVAERSVPTEEHLEANQAGPKPMVVSPLRNSGRKRTGRPILTAASGMPTRRPSSDTPSLSRTTATA
jgi:AraC-like DNA-binding protein